MKRENFKYLSVLALLFIVGLKVSSFHVFTHQDNASDTIKNCAICDMAVENQDAEFVATFHTAPTTPNVITVSKPLSKANRSESSPTYLHFKIFGRPPPDIV